MKTFTHRIQKAFIDAQAAQCGYWDEWSKHAELRTSIGQNP